MRWYHGVIIAVGLIAGLAGGALLLPRHGAWILWERDERATWESVGGAESAGWCEVRMRKRAAELAARFKEVDGIATLDGDRMTVRLPDVPPPAELRWEWRCLPVGVDLRDKHAR